MSGNAGAVMVELAELPREMAVRAWTIGELSARSGVSRNTLSGALRGKPVAPRVASRVIAALGACAASEQAFEVGARPARREASARAGGGSG